MPSGKRKSLDSKAWDFIEGGEATTTTELKAAEYISLSDIHLPEQQPRHYFDPQKMQGLVESVSQHGILEPLLVRTIETGGYELVAGERRYRAAKEVGLSEVPAVVRDLDNDVALQIALVENLQREDLNPVEEARGILQLLAVKLKKPIKDVTTLLYRMSNVAAGKVTNNVVSNSETQVIQSVFDALGLMTCDSFVKHRLSLLNLPQEVLDALQQGQLAYTKAKEIAKVKDEASRAELLKDSIAQSLSLTQIKDRVKSLRPPKKSEEGVQTHFDNTFKRAKKAKLWDDPKRSKKLETLLNQIDKLLEEE